MNEHARQLQNLGISHIFLPGEDMFAARAEEVREKSSAGKSKPQKPPPRTPPAGEKEVPRELSPDLSNLLRPAPILWTYFELQYDILGPGDPARQELIRNILSGLGKVERWPKGSSAFWPAHDLKDGKLVPDPELFWFGVRRINPLYIFCLGTGVLKALCPHQEFSLKPFCYGNSRFQPLPGPKDMLAGPEEERQENKNQAWKIFKKYTKYVR